MAEADAFADRIDLLDLDIQASGQAPLFNQEKYAKFVVSKRTGLPIQGADEQALQAQGGYTEDLSDEISGNAGAVDLSAYTPVWIREE